MQRTNMNQNKEINTEMLKEWSLGLMEIVGDFVNVLEESLAAEEKESADSSPSGSGSAENYSDAARNFRLLSYLAGISAAGRKDGNLAKSNGLDVEIHETDCAVDEDWIDAAPDDDARDDWDDDEWDDEWDDDDLDDWDDDDEDNFEDAEDNIPRRHGIRWSSEVDISTTVVILEPDRGAAFLPWKKARQVYPGLFRDRMELVCYDPESGFCFVRSGTEYNPEPGKICLRGPVIVLKLSCGIPVTPDPLEIFRIIRYFDRRKDIVMLPGGILQKVFSLQKGEKDGSEGI